MRIRCLIAVFCLAIAPDWAAEERITSLLRPIADGGPIPAEKTFYDAVDEEYINQLSPDSVREFLPLAAKLLGDTRPEARRYGLMCFLTVTLRRSLDSEQLMEPYVPDLLRIAYGRASPLRPMALHIMGNTWPKVSPKTVSYLARQLTDKDNMPDETSWIACTLFQAGSGTVIHDVVAFLRKQDNPGVTLRVLTCLHASPRTKNAEVLSLISASLDNPDASVRRRAIETVADIPMVERSPFLAQLSRMSTDPKEPDEIRSAAAEALKK